MKDLGPVSRFLGMQVLRDRARRVIKLTSTMHIDDMLNRFHRTGGTAIDAELEALRVTIVRNPNPNPN